MKFILAIIIFLTALLSEAVFLPGLFGIVLPLSFWAAIAGFLILRESEVMWFGLSVGLAASFFRVSFAAETILLFAACGFIFFLVRSLLEREGVIRDIAAAAAGILAFQFFQLPLGWLFGSGISSGAILLPGDLILAVVAACASGLCLVFFQGRKRFARAEYV